jgi:hypothetical protein
VPNPSFEIIDTCPYNGSGQIIFAQSWNNPTYLASTSPDLFDTCSTYISGYNIPNSEYGYIIPHTGGACAGIVTYVGPSGEAREYIQVELTDSLKAGKKYCVKFYVWLADSAQWAAYNFGVYFSKTLVDTSTYYNLPYIPQIINPSSNPLTTKGIWIEISGNFIASGGEKYVVIGNFDNSANTTAIFLGGANWCTWSYYFIDDVSVVLCDTVGIDEQLLKKSIKIYPMPSSGIFYIDVSNLEVSEILIYNFFGEIIYSQNINSVQENNLYTVKLNNNAEGIYFLKLKTSKGIITKKIMIAK